MVVGWHRSHLYAPPRRSGLRNGRPAGRDALLARPARKLRWSGSHSTPRFGDSEGRENWKRGATGFTAPRRLQSYARYGHFDGDVRRAGTGSRTFELRERNC
jgi:hypothetical protein